MTKYIEILKLKKILEKALFANDINSTAETENPKAKSLRWVANQIPDFEPETVDDKMLLAIKRYATAGATEIERLEAENAELKARLAELQGVRKLK